MILLENIHTKETHSFSSCYQAGKYLYQKGIAKSLQNQTAIQRAIKKGTTIFKHYIVYEIPDAK